MGASRSNKMEKQPYEKRGDHTADSYFVVNFGSSIFTVDELDPIIPVA
jgi:hypothetical protein